jgi:hemoglobin
MNKDIINREDIEILVNKFYDKLGENEGVKNIFFDRLGPKENWPTHLQTIINFWETVLLGATSYTGQSFAPHATMQLTKEHFDIWLYLFNETVDELYQGPIADKAKERAHFMGTIFLSKINFLNGGNLS